MITYGFIRTQSIHIARREEEGEGGAGSRAGREGRGGGGGQEQARLPELLLGGQTPKANLTIISDCLLFGEAGLRGGGG